MLTKFLRSRFVLVLTFTIGRAALLVDPGYYVPFLSDVQSYYKSSGIFLLFDEFTQTFETNGNILFFLRQLSDLGTLSQAIHYSRVKDKSDVYHSQNVQALYVVFLTSRANFDNFCALTAEHDMSYHTWLIVFAQYIDEGISETCHNPIGNPFHLVFNSRVVVRCYNDTYVKKWYSLYDNRTEVLELANWSRSVGIVYKRKHYYEQRFDLSGKTLKIATHRTATALANGKMTGFFDEILTELQNSMNFSVIRAAQEDAYGKWHPETRQWTGFISLLDRGVVDLVLAPVTVSKFRLDFVDFTKPLLLSANRIYFKRPQGALVQWSAYFRAFTPTAWGFIALMLIIASLNAAFIRVLLSESKFQIMSFSASYLLENFIRVWGMYCQQGVPDFPRSTPLRVVYFTTLALTVIVWAIYSASITSYLTVLTPTLPFSDVDGFVKEGSYKLIVLQNSSDQDIILSGRDPVLTKFKPLLKNPDELPENPFAGFQQVCKGKTGFYTSEAILKGVSAYIPCNLASIDTGQFECLAMALIKRSPYTHSINYNLRKLEDNGVIKKLKNWYFRKSENPTRARRSPISLWGIVPLLTIFAIGFAASILVLLAERFSDYRQRRQLKPRKTNGLFIDAASS